MRVGIVGGCGHVGLPLAVALAPHHEVVIYDRDHTAVDRVRRGEPPFRDQGLVEALHEALQRGLEVNSNPALLTACDAVVIVVGTPVDEHLNPSFDVLERVLGELDPVLRDGQTLVLRSTLYPGTTERTARRIERSGKRIAVAFCPERVAEGTALREIRELPQIISSFNEPGLAVCRSLFSPLGVDLVELAPLEAELGKLYTNVFRYIGFAIANQFFMIAEEAGVDFHRVLGAIKHRYPRAATMPGPGFAAGPCLLKDTLQMSAFNNNRFFLGHSAMLVNEGLPQFLIERMRTRWNDLEQRTVGLLGMAFKGDSDDPRDSLSYKLKKLLALHCRRVLTTDPHVEDPDSLPEEEVLARADLLVIGAPHQRYRSLDFRGKPVIDVWNHLGRGTWA